MPEYYEALGLGAPGAPPTPMVIPGAPPVVTTPSTTPFPTEEVSDEELLFRNYQITGGGGTLKQWKAIGAPLVYTGPGEGPPPPKIIGIKKDEDGGFWSFLTKRSRITEAEKEAYARSIVEHKETEVFGAPWETLTSEEKKAATITILGGSAAIAAAPWLLPILPATVAGGLKLGLATVTTTGVGALVAGAVVEPPEVITDPYEVVAGAITGEEVMKAGAKAKALEPELQTALGSYKTAGSQAESAQSALDAKWSTFLTSEGKLEVTDAQYRQYQKEYQNVENLIARASALGTTYGVQYSKYKKAYSSYQDIFGQLEVAQVDVSKYIVAGKVDYKKMVEDLGEGEATALLARAGYKPEIPLEIYEELSPGVQKYYTPSKRKALAYKEGIAGMYGRGVEFLYQPGVDWLRERGIAGQIGAGMYQYMVPHTIFTEMYPEKGAFAALTLIPHFGPTAGVATLTLGEVPAWQTAMGYSFAVLPYAVGPAVSVFRGVGQAVGKVPYLGTGLRYATWIPRQVLKEVGGAIKPIGLEYWAPWRLAYTAGKAVPGVGGWAYAKGWLGPTVPYSKMLKTTGVYKLWQDMMASEGGPGGPLAISLKAHPAELSTGYVGPSRGPSFIKYPTKVSVVTGRSFMGDPQWTTTPAPGYQTSLPSFPKTFGQIGTTLGQAVKAAPSLLYTQPYIKPALYTAALVAPLAILTMPAISAAITPEIDISILAKTDISAADQMLKQGTITRAQHQQIVSQIRTIQEVATTQKQFIEQTEVIVSEQLTEQEQSQYQEQREEIIREEQSIVQQEITRQQQRLQEMQQQRFEQFEIQQQQEIIQELQEGYQQFDEILKQEFPPQPPPTLPIIPLFPILPFFPGGVGGGRGFARGRRAGRRRYERVLWPFGEMVISLPAPWTGVRKEKVIRKKGKRPFGGRTPTAKFKGIRL